ncbi:LemA family protein [Candidatus Desantisbacteria bacterium]|nr:LemA family protein [Candidatus Desantisbacteria bacterium]
MFGKTGIVIGAVLLVILFGSIFFISGLNTVVTKDEAVKSAWAQVENQLKRRSDLIPNLVSTVKGFAAHEEKVIGEVAEARSKLAGTFDKNVSVGEKIEAARGLEGALSRLLVVVENYPNLKADQNFIRLQDELAGTENRIAVERMRFNETVNDFNTYVRKIPGNIFASFKGLKEAPYYKLEKEDIKVPEVEF